MKRFKVRASGSIAVFSRPDFGKTERVSYDVMTPSAARGLLEAIFWKPAFVWRIEEIAVLRPIQWISFRRNEVKIVASSRSTGIMIEDQRTQRNTVALKDVEYVITAHIELTDGVGSDDGIEKYERIFEHRLEKGQTFHHPYLGCREFAARVEPFSGPMHPIAFTRNLGLMFYDFDFRASSPKPLIFEALLDQGVLRLPSYERILKANGSSL